MQSVKLSTFSFFIEKRYQVAKEILDTEKKYLTCLRTLKEVRFIGAFMLAKPLNSNIPVLYLLLVLLPKRVAGRQFKIKS